MKCECGNQKTLLRIKEVAKMLGYAQGSVYNMVQRGEIPFIKLPTGSIRFDQEEIQRWIESGQEGGAE